MRKRITSACRISAFFVVVSLAISAGCARNTHRKTQGAVLGLTPEQEQIFMASYINAFPGKMITFVERALLLEVIREQDLQLGRLDEKTRAKVKQVLGVEALFICTYYDATGGAGTKKLRVRVVNSETGAIVGSVITQGRDDFEYHCEAAVQALKKDLMNGGHREYMNR